MRQYVTVEQLLSLTTEQQEKLREWWQPTNADVIYITDNLLAANARLTTISHIGKWSSGGIVIHLSCGGWCHKEECLIVFDIGKCLEYLSANSSIFNMVRYDDCHGESWNVRGTAYCGDGKKFYETLQPELVDALWEAVKKIL